MLISLESTFCGQRFPDFSALCRILFGNKPATVCATVARIICLLILNDSLYENYHIKNEVPCRKNLSILAVSASDDCKAGTVECQHPQHFVINMSGREDARSH